MKSNISFSDLKSRYIKNAREMEEIDKLNIDYKTIIKNKEKMIEGYENMIASVRPDRMKDFEANTKIYMEKIVQLENEIKEDKEKEGQKARLVQENKKILEEAKNGKEK